MYVCINNIVQSWQQPVVSSLSLMLSFSFRER